MSFLESYRLELELLGPVHVGTGEAFPAYSYLLDEGNKEALILDPGRLLELLNENQRKNFLDAVAQGPKHAQKSLHSLWRSHLVDPTPAVVRRVGVSESFIRTVKQATELAGLEFRTLPRSPLGAYLPGSSIKGALRTAWLFRQLLKQGRDVEYVQPVEFGKSGYWQWAQPAPAGEWPLIKPPNPKKLGTQVAQQFEALVLDYAGERSPDLYKDPFRQVRVSDSEPCDNLLLNRIGVFHPKGSMDGTVLLAETFRSRSKLHSVLRLHAGLPQYSHRKTVSQAIAARDLAKACREYYQEVAAREEEFARENQLKQALSVYQELDRRLQNDPQAFPLRIGFGSGRMSIRLALLLEGEEGQEPKTRKTAGHSSPKDGFPLGWAIARLEPY